MNTYLFTGKFAIWTSRLSLALGFVNKQAIKGLLEFLFFNNFKRASLYVTGVVLKDSVQVWFL